MRLCVRTWCTHRPTRVGGGEDTCVGATRGEVEYVKGMSVLGRESPDVERGVTRLETYRIGTQ